MFSERTLRRRACLAKASVYVNAGDVRGLADYIRSPEVQALEPEDIAMVTRKIEAAVLQWSIMESRDEIDL